MALDVLSRDGVQLRHGRAQFEEDLHHFKAGILDRRSFKNGWRKMLDPVEVRTTSLVDDHARVDPRLLVGDPAAFTHPELRRDGLWGEAEAGGRRRVWREIRRQHNLQV